MEQRIPTAAEKRLFAFDVMRRVREGLMLPSTYIRIIDDDRIHIDEREVLIECFDRDAPPEFKESVRRVRDALDIIGEFDQPFETPPSGIF